MAELNKVTELIPGVESQVEDMFTYQPWTQEFVDKDTKVRTILSEAVKVILANVPPSPDRTVAIRKLREARMDCNSAITHSGKY